MLNGNVISTKENDYMVLETLNHMGNIYLFTNVIKNNDPTDEYFIFKIESDEIIKIVDEKLLNELFEKFKPLLEKMCKDLIGV